MFAFSIVFGRQDQRLFVLYFFVSVCVCVDLCTVVYFWRWVFYVIYYKQYFYYYIFYRRFYCLLLAANKNLKWVLWCSEYVWWYWSQQWSLFHKTETMFYLYVSFYSFSLPSSTLFFFYFICPFSSIITLRFSLHFFRLYVFVLLCDVLGITCFLLCLIRHEGVLDVVLFSLEASTMFGFFINTSRLM